MVAFVHFHRRPEARSSDLERAAVAVVALILSIVGPAGLCADPSPVVRREVGSLVLENIPETPSAIHESLRRYENARAAFFEDWLPDGTMLITTRFGATAQLHRVAAPGAERYQLTFFDEPIAAARAQPQSQNRFLFTKDVGGAEYYQGYMAGSTGAETLVTEPGTRTEQPVFSKDSAWLAWSQVTPGSPDYDIVVLRPDDPANRRVLLKGQGALAPLAFSPDGRQLLVRKYISIASSKLFLLDVASGGVRELNPSPQDIAYADGKFAPDGRGLLLISNEGSEFARLVRLDIETGRQTSLTAELNWDVEQFDISPDGRFLAYGVDEDGRSRVVVQSFATSEILPVPTPAVGVLTALKFSPDSKRLAIGLNAATSPADVWSYDLASGGIDRWTESETGGLDPGRLVEPSLVRFKSFDGREIPAFVYKPRAIRGRPPVIIAIHGGPEAQERPFFSPVYQYWVGELGAAVIAPNVRGSDGYGKAYLALDNGLKRQDAVKDVGALLDWIATQPDLDPNCVVVAGGSYGGFMTLSVFAAYGDRLAGAYDVVGMSNLITFLEHTEGYRRDLRRAEYGDERDPAVHEFMEKTAPINNTARMTKPLFVVAGRNDPRVPYTEAEQIIAKVRAQGVEVWYMLAKDEGHGFRKKPNRDAQREAETLFLRKVLQVGVGG